MIFINHKEDTDGRIVFVEIKGALNSETTPDFEDYINQLLDRKKYFIIIDAEGLEYVSSAGIGVILFIQKKIISSRGFFIICNVSEEITALYSILGFDKIIKISVNRDEAVKIMEKQLKLIENEKYNEKQPDPDEEESISFDSTGLEMETEKPGIVDTKGQNVEERTFDHPIILECASCKGMIRVKKSGNYICPDCKTEFLVEPDQTVVF